VANIYEKLKDNEKVRSIIGSDTSQRKKKTADDWRTGAVEVLISSTCALVGNENKKCRHIIIVDRIYDLSNLLQAIGRLRKEQGGEDSCITHFLSSEEVDDETGTNKATTAKMKELANIGFSVDEIKHEAEQQLTPGGYNSLFTKQGCLLKNLSLMFGGDRENDCRRCTNCDTIYNTTIATHGRAPSFLSPNSTEIQGQIYDDTTRDKEEASSTTPDNDMENAQMMSLLQALNQDSPKETKVNWGAVSKPQSKKRPLKRKDDRQRKNTKLHGQHQPTFKLGGNNSVTVAAKKKEEEKQKVEQNALSRIRDCYKRCLFCTGAANCDGLCVVPRGRCLNCFSNNHKYADCPNKVRKTTYKHTDGSDKVEWVGNRVVTEFLRDKACVICFDPHCNEKNFDPQKPHRAQKRIKGALFRNMRHGETFEDTVKRCYATSETQAKFLSNM
jgi:hypothetical protein